LPADTEYLPVHSELDGLPAPDGYSVRTDRWVLEVSIRALGQPIVRGRLGVDNGMLEISAGGDDHSLRVEVATPSLWTTVPLLARSLIGPLSAITFASTEFSLFEDRTVEILGQLEIGGAPRELRLTGDLRFVAEDRIVLWARGVLPPPRRRPGGAGRVAGLLARRRLHVEIAAEFVA
jgi:hypothetical protein